jgi:hypothetical protein
VVAQQLYTLWVGGSNPSAPTIFPKTETLKAEKLKRGRALSPVNCASRGGEISGTTFAMKSRIVSALVILVSAGFLFAQAEQVKGKAKDLKKKVEGQQTNQVDKANPPKK